MMLVIQIALGIVLAVVIFNSWKILLKWFGYLIVIAAIAVFFIFLFTSTNFRNEVINILLMILGLMSLAFLIYQFYRLVLFVIEVVIFQAEYYGFIKKHKGTTGLNHLQETDDVADEKRI